MDKEIKEILKKINKMLDKELKKGDKLKKDLEKAFDEPALISIKKDKSGKAETHIEGTNLALLITLAGLENTILDKLNVPTGLFDVIKDMVGTKEVSNE